MTEHHAEEARRAQLASLAEELTDAWNTHDPDRVAALAGPDYEGENVGESEPHRGPQGLRDSVAGYLAAFPDLCFTVEEIVIQGDRVGTGVAGVCYAPGDADGHPAHGPADCSTRRLRADLRG